MSQKKRVLNVGGGDERIPLPSGYADFEVLRLDIDPAAKPDVLLDARQLKTLEAGQFDAVYCSHNLEHYHRHDVPTVLHGFQHVLKPDGFAHIIVPDIGIVMREVVARKLDLEDTLYTSPGGPIKVLDIIWGWSAQIERSGNDYYSHRTGFTQKSLAAAMSAAGFVGGHIDARRLEIALIAFKGTSSFDAATRKQFGLSS
jgi:SAM-dependent methyltransferase